MQKKVHILTVGCPKNQVDSEVLAAQLVARGYTIAKNAAEAEVAVVNTCGFINPAKRESIDTILEVAQHKKSGRLKKLVVTGCLVERYRKELQEGLSEVDAFYGTNELMGILSEFTDKRKGRLAEDADKYAMLGDRVLSTPGHYAYLKISEGCDNPCSFCAIPLMRGKHISKPFEAIVHEAEILAERGVKELIVVAQDTTNYGLDIYRRRELPRLLQKLNEVAGIEWIRLMYAFPSKFPEEVLDVMRESRKICKYIDIPIQHVSDKILKSMRRGITRRKLEELLYKIREKIPGVAIRTTLIVGYPGEGEQEFEELSSFLEDFRFERLGAFTYSIEEGTASSILGDTVPEEEKERRQAVISELQREILSRMNAGKVGRRLEVLIDRKEERSYIGRTSHDAPEIDSEVIVTSHKPLEIGNITNVSIDEAYEHDLYGTAY